MLEILFKRFFWVFDLAALGVCAFLAARTVNTVVANTLREIPRAPEAGKLRTPRTGREEDRSRTPTDLSPLGFYIPEAVSDTEGGTPEGGAGDEGATSAGDMSTEYDESSLVRTDLPYTLMATVVTPEPRWSLSTIAKRPAKVGELYAVGDGLGEEAVIVEIRRRKVIIRRNEGRFEFIDPEEIKSGRGSTVAARRAAKTASTGEGIKKVSESEYIIAREEIDKNLENLSKIATQARIVPSFKNGKANGFKLFSIRPNSIYSRIGIRNGDIIQKINGYDINSPERALEIYQKLKDSTQVEIQLERRGKKMSKTYKVQ